MKKASATTGIDGGIYYINGPMSARNNNTKCIDSILKLTFDFFSFFSLTMTKRWAGRFASAVWRGYIWFVYQHTTLKGPGC